MVISGTALSPEDFAIQVVAMFAVGDLAHDGSQGMGGLIQHLTVAMEHDILDALDRAEHKRADFLDPVAVTEEGEERTGKVLADLGGEADDLPAWLDGEAFKARVYALVENEPDLKEMAVAVFEVNALNPREIAAVCMTSSADIQNRKRRFDRLLQQHGFKPKEGGQNEE
jgi:DNA-directed RNA polymerase specialized sigma24 family protein